MAEKKGDAVTNQAVAKLIHPDASLYTGLRPHGKLREGSSAAQQRRRSNEKTKTPATVVTKATPEMMNGGR